MQSLNDAAFAARTQLVKALPLHMTIRRKHAERGMRVRKATKSRLVAEVGSTRDYIEDQSVGATRTTGAIPTSALRRNPRSVVTKRRWPGALLDDSRHFMVDARTKKGPWARRTRGLRMVVRRRPGRRRRQRILYVIPRSQKIKPRFPFEAIARRAGRAEFHRAFPGRLQRALVTAK